MNVRLGMHGLLALALSISLGCNSLQFLVSNEKIAPGDKQDRATAAPSKKSLRVSQFVFLSDFEIKKDLPLFRELSEMRELLNKELQLPTSTTPVQVFVFEDRDRYERYMHAKYPDLPKRRAFFVAQAHVTGGAEDLIVYTYWGERIREDLRHELTHALLHSVLKDVPLWLDEGLAEYYEAPPESQGINYHHLDQLRRGDVFHPDLGRLEKLSMVRQMTPAEYRESWAWVHLMLRDKSEAKLALIGYLQKLRTTTSPGPLQPSLVQVFPSLEDALEKHLEQLDSGTRPFLPSAQK